MAQIIVRNLDESIKIALHERALLRGTSMEAEARDILQRVLARPKQRVRGLGTSMRARFAAVDGGIDLATLPPAQVLEADLPD